ncbi:MAG: hypothetical protein CTY16_16090 [Methylobacter sp.]|nr:MAG: hypothetical protein CTY16_16090 [Methylobacter sp.]
MGYTRFICYGQSVDTAITLVPKLQLGNAGQETLASRILEARASETWVTKLGLGNQRKILLNSVF